MIDDERLAERILRFMDPDELVEVLDLNTEQLVSALWEEILERSERVEQHLEDSNE